MIHHPATLDKKRKLEDLFKKPGEGSVEPATASVQAMPASLALSSAMPNAQPAFRPAAATPAKPAKEPPRRQCCGRISYFQHLETCPYCGKRTLKAVLPKQKG